MSSEVLRRAAALMRERVEAVVDECGVMTASDAPWFDATDIYGNGGNGPDPVHAHIASWHPAIAVSVADLLDGIADDFSEDEDYTDSDYVGKALDLARVYLGEDA